MPIVVVVILCVAAVLTVAVLVMGTRPLPPDRPIARFSCDPEVRTAYWQMRAVAQQILDRSEAAVPPPEDPQPPVSKPVPGERHLDL